MKILYGLISDNFPIFGSRRKSYLFMGAVVNFLSMYVLSQNSKNDLTFTTICFFMYNLSVAFSDVIVDSLMVIQSRRRPEDGSELLQTWSWCCLSVGGFCGSITAAFMIENYDPTYCF